MFFRKTTFVYYVVYHFRDKTMNGTGSLVLRDVPKIKTAADVQHIRKLIEKTERFDSVVIASWTKLKD